MRRRAISKASPQQEPQQEEEAKPILRHLPGFYGIELNAGLATLGPCCTLAGSYYLTAHTQTQLALGTSWARYKSVTYLLLLLQPALAFTLLSNQRNVYWNLIIGAMASYEYYLEKRQPTKQHTFNVGLVLGTEVERFIVERYALLFGAGGRLFLWDKPYGRLGYYLTLGLRVTG